MPPKSPTHRFGPYEFVPAQQELRCGDERKPLPKSMNRLLLLLVSRPGEIVTREQIADALWTEHGNVDITAGINTAINRLRTLIGDNNGHGVFIETVVGAGYRFTSPVESIPLTELASVVEANQAPVIEAEETQAAGTVQLPNQVKPSRRLLFAGIGIAACILTAATAIWKKSLDSQSLAATPVSSTEIYTPTMQPVTRDDPEDQLAQQAISPSGKYVSYSDRNGLFITTQGDVTPRRLALPDGITVTRIAWFPDETALLISGKLAASAPPGGPPIALWRLPVAGGALLQLSEGAAGGSVSPNGSRLAFLRAGQTELWVADADGGRPRRLAQATQGDIFSSPLWSPAGDRLVVDRVEPALFNLPPADPGKVTYRPPQKPIEITAVYESYRVSDGMLLAKQPGVHFDSAVLLPNGMIYYLVATEGTEPKIAITQTDIATGAFRSAPSPLTIQQAFSSDFSSAEQLSVSRDGTVLSAVLNRKSLHVFVADLLPDSHQPPKLEHEVRWSRRTFTTYPTTWSRDGKMILSDEGFLGPISIVGQTLDGTKTQVFAAAGAQDSYAQAYFSVDGRWLMYLDLRHNVVQSINRVPAQGGEAQVVPNTQGIAEFRCSISAAGRCVVRKIEDKQSITYYELDPILGVGKAILRTPWKPTALGDWSISPDGKTIAAADHDPARPGVQLLPLSGVAPRSVPVLGYGPVLGVSWTVNGHDLFVHTLSPTGYDALYLDAAGTVTLLRQSADLIWSVQSPDGKKTAYPLSTPSNRNVWVGTTHLGLH